MGSNGLTSARHDVFSKDLATKYPESFDPILPENLVYSGSKQLTDLFEDMPLNIGKLILSPTRTYAPIVNQIFQSIDRTEIHGMIHCSGGAQTKILHFIDNLHIIKESGTTGHEMYQVFNMGHRMEFYLPQTFAEEIISISKSFDVDAQIVGRVEASTKKRLTIKTTNESYEYF